MPNCNQRHLCDDDSCEICFERSFASHPKAVYWSDDNVKKPREVFKSSGKKYKFLCSCQHTFEVGLNTVNQDSWCPYCCVPPKKLCDNLECKVCFDRSFASHDKSAYWSSNNSVQPRNVIKGSNKKYWFKCHECKHNFESSLNNVTNACGGKWCPYCSSPPKEICTFDGCDWCFNKSFASHPKSKCWYQSNSVQPRNVFKFSHYKATFQCDKCCHTFESSCLNVSSGTWCPYCDNSILCEDPKCMTCFNKSFASITKSENWSNKNRLTPRQVFKSSGKKYWFDCDICLHKFESRPACITSGRWCPYCCNPPIKMCYDEDCNWCLRKSFASHDKSSCFDTSNNEKTPRQIFKACNDKYNFKCDQCLQPFNIAICKITCENNWCPNCKHKTERKLYKYLLSQNIETTRQAKFDWCKNEQTGKHLPFDFVIEDKRIIIEVDGLQHFEQVSNWQSPVETQSRDLLKMKLAQENGYTVIRIFQEDVLYDSYDWKTQLMNALIQYDSPTCLYMSKDENRYCQYQSTTPSS